MSYDSRKKQKKGQPSIYSRGKKITGNGKKQARSRGGGEQLGVTKKRRLHVPPEERARILGRTNDLAMSEKRGTFRSFARGKPPGKKKTTTYFRNSKHRTPLQEKVTSYRSKERGKGGTLVRREKKGIRTNEG